MPAVTKRPRRARTARRGFSLMELMIVLVLLGVVVGGIMTVVVRQQRFYRGAADLIDTRRNIREAADVLPSDLRGIAPQFDDIVAMSDKSIDFRAQIGNSVVCNVITTAATLIPPAPAQRGAIVVPPVNGVPGRDGLTSYSSQPRVGDVAFILDTLLDGPGDDSLRAYQITGIPAGTTACLTSGLTPNVGGAPIQGKRYNLSRLPPVPLLGATDVHTAMYDNGSIVRFARYVHYELYQSPTDSRWYLGFADSAVGAARGAMQPVSGPYLPYTASSGSGMRLTYFDSAGTQITATDQAARRRVRRIQLTVRSQTRSQLNVPGFTKGYITDSLTVSVTPRNIIQP